MQNKPELLLPAGNIESFFAAIDAGADAVYVGLKQFNARGRALNFTQNQFVALLKEAKSKNVLVYATLNIVIKNVEIESLIDYLQFFNEAGVDGIIIQDWGTFYLAKKFFPQLKIHASTQLGVHNSLGTRFSFEKGFKRVVLARELTLNELEDIVKKSLIETEVFVHGALCYSFSGMCLFSSYNGGRGANRGMCAQPCRRIYNTKNRQHFLFNLKDNQLLEFIPQLCRIGIDSLKIEGRLKSGEYTFQVGSAYRMALDEVENIPQALEKLELDFGRKKTSYFIGKEVKSAQSDQTSTGIFLGRIKQVDKYKLLFSSTMEIISKNRLRILSSLISEPIYITVKNPVKEGNLIWIEKEHHQNIQVEDEVYLVKLQERKFQNNLEPASNTFKMITPEYKKQILRTINQTYPRQKEELFFRIGTMDWFSRINFQELDGLFLSFSKKTWLEFHPEDVIIQTNRNKIFVELPKFIAETSIDFYARLIKRMVNSGISNFVISNVSQKLLIPDNCRVITNENVYTFNDAAIRFLKNEGVDNFVYPFEIDFETLDSLVCKSGILPVYFYPELFYSRMPVQLENENGFSSEDGKTKYKRFRKNGITIIVPEKAVSILHQRNFLDQKGFHRYLIDVSYDVFSKNRLKTLKTRFLKSEQIQPTTTFNFTKGLK